MFNKEGMRRDKVKITLDGEFENSKLLFDYLSKNRGYNLFLIDEIDSMKVRQLKQYIDTNDKVNTVKLYRELVRDIDNIREYHCYNNISYRSNFRALAKEIYLFLKDSWLIYNPEFSYIARVLRFISTSSLYEINRYLKRRSYSMFYLERINIDPDMFYCHHITLEAFLCYSIELLREYCK